MAPHAPWIAGTMLLVAACPLHAQACWRGRPPPSCRAFAITEIGYSRGLHRSAPFGAGPGDLVAAEAGWMVNVNPRLAVGGTGFAANDSDGGSRFALKPRVRWWQTQSVSLEASAGILLAGNHGNFPGATAHVALNVRDWLALSGQLEIFDRASGGELAQSDALWWIGGKLGSQPAAVVSGIILLGLTIWALGYEGS